MDLALSAWEVRKAWTRKIYEFGRENTAECGSRVVECGSRVVEFESRLRYQYQVWPWEPRSLQARDT